MKFRFYQLFPVCTIALLVWAMLEDIMMFTEPDGAQMLVGNFKLLSANGDSSWAVIALGAILIFTVLVNAFSLVVSFFSNFELQKRSAILSMLLLTGYYIILLVTSLILVSGAEIQVFFPVLLPFIGILLSVVFFKLANREEAKIISRASGFRLRD